MSQPSLTKMQLRNIFTLTIAAFTIASCVSKAPEITAADWPQYKKDNFRGATSATELDLSLQGKAWEYTASQHPAPAWYGPAKEDTYARSGPLPSMRDYDLAFYPIIVGKNLYFGSSADDAIHCIDANTGKEKWLFTTNGPIRIAPTYFDGKLYFGSDDGYVYCIDAFKGKLKWKFSPSPAEHQKVFNNGRFISFWPIRTGVLVEDGVAYFGASLLPWKKSYICAIDLETGKLGKAGTYVREYNNMNMTMEGAMASTGAMLIQPQGRISPAFIQKSTGENKSEAFNGNGGCFVLVTPEQNWVHSQTSRHKGLIESPIEKQPEFATFKDGKEMIVKGDTSYVLNETSISAYHHKTKRLLWHRRQYKAHRIIIAGNTLFAGGVDKVYGINIKNGLPLWEGNVEGAVYALAVGNNALYASTGEGKLYCFKKGGENPHFNANNLTRPAGIDTAPKKSSQPDKKPVLQFKSGPFVNAISRDSVLLELETYEKTKVTLVWRSLGTEIKMRDGNPVFKHRFMLPVRKDFTYDYTISSTEGNEADFEYDNFFNYHLQKRDELNFPKVDKEIQNKVDKFLEAYPIRKGVCLVLGKEAELIGFDLAAKTDLNIVKPEASTKQLYSLREELQSRGVYGRKFSVLQVNQSDKLPIISDLADLVWVNEGGEFKADEVIRLIAPGQHAMIYGIKNIKSWLSQATLDWQIEMDEFSGGVLLTKKRIEDSGTWTHQYANPDNSSFGGESLWGASSTSDFEVQWMGRPGPRFQTDRSGRKPAPLAVNGRMFVQGNQRVIAVNVHNGTVLWAKDFPGLVRMNVLRDCSNWAADEAYLYVVKNENLLMVDQKDGNITASYPVSKFQEKDSDWSYIAVVDDKLIGSSVPKGAKYTNFYGGEGWYDAQSGPLSYKVLSTMVFSLKKDGSPIWEYIPQGAIVNPTITVYKNQLTFVETRSPNAESLETGRGGDEIYTSTWIVALDHSTGQKLWETRLKITPALTAFFMAAGNEKYVVVSSSKGQYDIKTFNSNDGKNSWNRIQKWFEGHHGAHMSKPAIVGDRLVQKPAIYKLETGEQLAFNVPKAGHGCAHYALTEQSMFYRGLSITQFNFDSRNFSKWERLRPDCWLSTIPAQGMILSPEAGGGCSCGNWLETSMVMAPISRAPITITGLTESTRLDYKNETWSEFASSCNFDEFNKILKVELSVKPGVEGDLYYTTDGSEPNKDSQKYSEPFSIEKSSKIKAAIFIEKDGKERRFVREQKFNKVDEK